jgi:hypothetical protein
MRAWRTNAGTATEATSANAASMKPTVAPFAPCRTKSIPSFGPMPGGNGISVDAAPT